MPRTNSSRASMRVESRHHSIGADGHFTHNRKGIALCSDFQLGKCLEVAEGSVMICGKDKSKVHQCA
eukprot:739079-Amphidinium_carterae.1